MKKLFYIAAIGAALGASSAMASPTSNAASNKLDVQEVRDSSLQNTRAAKEAFKSIRGAYAMDDGSTLWLYQDSGAFVAEVGGQAPFEVIATKSGTFVTANGATEIKFVRNAGGQVANVVLTKLS